MKNLGVAFAGGHGKRRENDFYPTPPEATRALLPLIKHWPQQIWEPCCGDGAMSKVLESAGFMVISTDIEPRGYGAVRDFFEVGPLHDAAIITNPPFNRAQDFIWHANAIGTQWMALLLKATYWHAAKRLGVFQHWPPSSIHPLTWRLDFNGRGAPTMDVMWCLWEPGQTKTRYEPIARPVSETAEEYDALLAGILD